MASRWIPKEIFKVDTPAVVAKLSESGTILNLAGCRSAWGCVWDGGEENATGLAIDPGTNDLYVDKGGGYVSHFNSNCPLSQTNYYYSSFRRTPSAQGT